MFIDTPDNEVLEPGDVDLQSGVGPQSARLTYKTYDSLNSLSKIAIGYAMFFSEQYGDNETMTVLDVVGLLDNTPP